MDVVKISNKVWKKLNKLPKHIELHFERWAESVELEGIYRVRMIKGYHDEPLKGQRKGQRSVRISKGYRIIYHEEKGINKNIILIEEINKHDY